MAAPAAPTRNRNAQAQRQQRAAVRPIPFTAAAHEHVEMITVDNVGALTAATQARGPFDIPAYGFLRHVMLEVTFSGGVGAGTPTADAPFSVFQTISLLDVNGAPIFGPLDGFATAMANVYGGYAFRQDPRLSAAFVGTSPNYRFLLRVPIEITRHNGYGAIANQNAAASYKLQYTINTSLSVWSVAPATPVTNVQIRSWVECWSQPTATDLTGRPQRREPPGHGTTQFWSSFTKAGLAAGQLNLIHPRVGNLIRNLVYISRDVAGARINTVFPDPFFINWDARQMTNESQIYRIDKQSAKLAGAPTQDVGVFVMGFNDITLGHAGDEEPNLWLPTVQATRLELTGNTALAGSIQVITNDIAPVEVDPQDRYAEVSETGFHPNMGQPIYQGA